MRAYFPFWFAFLFVAVIPLPSLGEDPALPLGLETSPQENSSEPALPAGIFSNEAPTEQSEERKPWLDLSGFADFRAGVRTVSPVDEKQASLGESRLQLQADKRVSSHLIRLTTDFLYDPVRDEHDVDLETGQGVFDLREGFFQTSPLLPAQLKVGRQVLTWGLGDLIFINDLFPKDWNSFFIGRDVEYLKAPSDAAKFSYFLNNIGVDFVYTPRFDADRFIDGNRLSFYQPAVGDIVGRSNAVQVTERDNWFTEDEFAARLFGTIESYELAAYFYSGYWKSPNGVDPLSGNGIFPRLNVYGASARGPLASGLASLEVGYYDSRDDYQGDDPFVRNSEFRMIAGFEREIASELTASLQYYLEYTLDYGQYRSTLPPTALDRDEDRQLLTLRLTQLLMQQNLTLSLFTFFSPTDEDAYFRPKIHYKWSDQWAGEVGGNVFLGKEKNTFWGQFHENTNIYAAVRYSFS
ncbi:MAG: hypothetical protein KDD55_13050 [Bdellovibrionales bacterium]|nr:hypothetical protein [Bdellovibrionales bacterium]